MRCATTALRRADKDSSSVRPPANGGVAQRWDGVGGKRVLCAAIENAVGATLCRAQILSVIACPCWASAH